MLAPLILLRPQASETKKIIIFANGSTLGLNIDICEGSNR